MFICFSELKANGYIQKMTSVKINAKLITPRNYAIQYEILDNGKRIYAWDKLGDFFQSGNGGKLITHEPDIRSYLPLSNTKESIFSAQETVIH